MIDVKIQPVDAPWITSASKIPDRQIGDYRIATGLMPAGLYRSSGPSSYFWVKEDIQFKRLQVLEKDDWLDWMVDNPQHWLSTWELAQQAKGKVLVGGLGLGLLWYHLLYNPRVTNVRIVERSIEVIELVRDGINLHISNIGFGDFFDILPRCVTGLYCPPAAKAFYNPFWNPWDGFDTIITDFHMGEEYTARAREIVAFCKNYYPDAKILTHAYQYQFDTEEAMRNAEIAQQILLDRR